MARLGCRWCGGSMEHAERAARYCSEDCKDEYKVYNAKPRSRSGRPTEKKPIDPKWLVRGTISNSTTRSVMDN